MKQTDLRSYTCYRYNQLLILESFARGHTDHFIYILADREFSAGCYLLTAFQTLVP